MPHRDQALSPLKPPTETMIMGDKSPKATQKQAAQKKSKANTAMTKKKNDIAAKQVGGKKK
jgi:hypothetical protein